jgi:hypothetical protein
VRLPLAWLAVFLLALSVLAPAAAAFADCPVQCAGGGEEDCGTSGCCSCCPGARFTAADVPATDGGPSRDAERLAADGAVPGDAEPRGILHVPKTSLS